MFIDEIILEGFKTYVNRTVIKSFDPQFNAITGFNGSGKSNILDAIQFLLGSTNKEMLRLKSNITEIIYKEGCSGIEKASVSIKFKCPNKNLRPTGFESSEQLLITRQITKDKVSKFFVNGLASNLSKIKSLFRSVHLNIDNPHFLVKQGQITKIINLKPQQLLGMIEETAGTAIYNKTKVESERMIEKKDIKLNSINEILRTSIMPQMDKLRSDRMKYTAFKEKQNLMKKSNEDIKTYEFITKNRLIQMKQSELISIRDILIVKNSEKSQKSQRQTQVQGQISILKNKAATNQFIQFMKIQNTLNQRKNQQKQIRNRLQKVQNDASSIKTSINQGQQFIERKRQQHEWKAKEVIHQERQKQEFQNLISELNDSKGEQDAMKILQKQITQQKDIVKEIQLEIRTMKSKHKSLEEEEKLEQRNQKDWDLNNSNLQQTLDQIKMQIAKMENVSPPSHVEDPQLTNNYLQSLDAERKRMINQYFQLRFSYNDPEPNFNRKTVKGKIFTLFRVKDKTHEKALEIGAGGKLYNIVVDNEKVSKLVIDRECFGKNVSIVPNNKIRFKQLSAQCVHQASRIAHSYSGLAKPAYELIEYSKDISNSIMFAFSNFIVCSNQDIAKKIAFHPRLSCKCVTYDGDIFERGTLTGGHMNSNSLILGIYNQYRKVQEKINQERTKFDSQKQTYNQYLLKMQQYKRIKKDIDAKLMRKQKLQQKMMEMKTNFKKRNYKDQIQAVHNRIQTLQTNLQNENKKQEQLCHKVKKGGKSVEEQKKQLVTEKRKYEKKLTDLKKQCSYLEVQIENGMHKLEDLKNNDNTYQEQILKLEEKLRTIREELNNLQFQFDVKEEEKKKKQREQAMSQSKLRFLLNQQTVLKDQLLKLNTEIVTLNKDVECNEKIIQVNKEEVKKISEECSWLENLTNVEIISDFNYEQAVKNYKYLTVQVDKLKKSAKITIDDHSYEKLQEQYKSLLEKRSILEQDKLTLFNNMHDLDEKRTKTLETCYNLVRENLGKIFNDLLPGATAHLNLIDHTDVTKGAELQVQFNHIKKELSQLSGGQRSLLALSFILALLLYKPSPFYILDEIDSALDLSHTQNIGYMISQRFPQSQFIIISLKEGMFQNANVLYKVYFTEGESKVDRQVLKKK